MFDAKCLNKQSDCVYIQFSKSTKVDFDGLDDLEKLNFLNISQNL